MTLSEKIINRKSTVNANTVFMSAPASSLLWADMEKRQLRGPPRARAPPSRLHYYKKIEGKSGRGRPSQRVWSSSFSLLSWASKIKQNFRYDSL